MSTKLISILIVLIFNMPEISFCQMPTTNIYHCNITKVAKKYRLKSPQFLTAFNKSGYNNQPSYFADKEIYFATDYYDSGQTEIAKFDLFAKSLTRITYTDEKEYSPIKVPGRESFSVVRAEADSDIQALSLYPIDGIGYAKRYMNNTSNIGYHTWLDDETVALFLVEAPHHNLAIANVQSERRKIIIDKVGRCLKVDNAKNLLFVHKESDDRWYLKSYNAATSRSSLIVETLQGAEDFELMNDGTIIMGKDSKLYAYKPQISKDWELIKDLSSWGVKNITRIASRRNSLVIVDES